MQTDYLRIKEACESAGIACDVLADRALVHWDIAWTYKVRPGDIPDELGPCLRVFQSILMIFGANGQYIGSFVQNPGWGEEEYFARGSNEPRNENEVLYRPPRWVTDKQARKTSEVLRRYRAKPADSKDMSLIQDVMSSSGVSPDLFSEAQRCKLALYEQIEYEADPGRRRELGRLISELGEVMGDPEPERAIARSRDGGRNE